MAEVHHVSKELPAFVALLVVAAFIGSLFGLFFSPEDGGSILVFVQNVSELQPDYTAFHLRRQYST
jgi:hypothetical protein